MQYASLGEQFDRAQWFPIVGPLLFSPINILINTPLLVINATQEVFSRIKLASLNETQRKKQVWVKPDRAENAEQTVIRLHSITVERSQDLIFSVINLLSLGVLGLIREAILTK